MLPVPPPFCLQGLPHDPRHDAHLPRRLYWPVHGGGATALGVIVATVATEWQRICGLALGDVPATPPLLSKRFLQERPLARPLDRPAPRGPA